MDYRRLKDMTQKVVYPMPRIDECIDHMREATVFTKMDLRSGFHQILVFPEHKERTAFQTRWGTFQYCVMPFGLCNAPATFQRTMNALLQEFHAFCEVYVDDIVVYSKSLEDHARHLAWCSGSSRRRNFTRSCQSVSSRPHALIFAVFR